MELAVLARAEPVHLLARLRTIAATDPARARALLPVEVAALAAVGAGASPEDVERACDSYARELWLWLAGERTWEQCCEGLSGRIGRRALT
jgi:hypothetical protein